MKSDMDARVSQSEIPQVYDSLSKTYDIWGKLAESKARNRAIELAEIHDGQKILEAAVGTGLAFFEIVQRNPNGINIGIDVSPGMTDRQHGRDLEGMGDSQSLSQRTTVGERLGNEVDIAGAQAQ